MSRAPLLLVLALGALWPSPAAAQSLGGDGIFLVTHSPTARVVAQSRSPTTVTGELVVTFAGDPATCAAAGRCDTSGSLTWRPARRHNLYLADVADGRKRSVQATLFPAARPGLGAEVFSHVRRARTGGGTGLCTDARYAPAGLDAVVAGRQLAFGVAPNSAGPLESRCGGPLWEDIRYVLPRPRWALSEVRERGGRADLRAEQTFVAAGLRGTVRSTLVARIGRARVVPPDAGSTSDQDDDSHIRTQRWRVARVSGAVRVDVRGAADPGRCESLDACGLAGSVTFTPRPSAEHAEVFTYRTDRGPTDERFGGGGGWVDGGTASASFTRPDAAAPCSDTSALRGGALLLSESRGQVTVVYDPFPGVRSRCAGPLLGAAFEGTARGTVALERFRRSRVAIRLTRGTSRTTGGYAITSHPDLTLELVRR